MFEPKFKKGDMVKVRTTGDKVIVLEYKINYGGDILNAFNRNPDKSYPSSVITDEVLCEGKIDGKFQKKYINESSLELSE